MSITHAPIAEPADTLTVESRRLLLSCPACGNSRTVTPIDRAWAGALATLQCGACGGHWDEIMTPYSRLTREDI